MFQYIDIVHISIMLHKGMEELTYIDSSHLWCSIAISMERNCLFFGSYTLRLQICNSIIDFSKTPSTIIADCQNLFKRISVLKKNIIMQWIPSHCGILGNENADTAKKGTGILQTSTAEMPYYIAASMIHRIIYNNHYTTIQERNLDSFCGLQLPKEPHRSTRLLQLTGR